MPDQIIILHTNVQLKHAHVRLDNMPLDGSMEIVIRQVNKKRSARQNSLMWSDGLMSTIADQAWVGGRQFSSTVWHEQCKIEFLPEITDENYAKMVMKTYEKWIHLPNGTRQMVGSTARLTEYGMSVYIGRIEAWAASELGVQLPVRPN